MHKNFQTYTNEIGGGRVVVLFLLFLLALYEFYAMGITGMALVCVAPLIVIIVNLTFKYRMMTFWALIVVNYFVQFKIVPLTFPTSVPNELLQLTLIAMAIIDNRDIHFERLLNVMLLALMIWTGFCILQLMNDTCGLGMNVGGWYTGARMMAFQLIYIFVVFTLYINSPQRLIHYLFFWAGLSLFAVFWTWKQKVIGLTPTESSWLHSVGYTTHLLNGGTLLRYWSCFNDAANYGINAAATATAFIIIGIMTRINKYRYFFLIVAAAIIWGMFQSGTRTAIFCLFAGLMTFIVLSKSLKIAVPFTIAFGLFVCMLMFTNIGNSNQQIRRMRSAFNRNDASANVRDINQAAMKKYLQDAPWGIGIGLGYGDVPPTNKYEKLSKIPPDSEYVYIWIHTGVIGITLFLICTAIMLIGASFIVMFKLKNRTLIGIGGGLCGAFVAIQLGGYGNQVLMQFPNCLTFYGGLSLVYVLPYLEPEWEAYENKLLAKQEEKKRLKLEKKRASRV